MKKSDWNKYKKLIPTRTGIPCRYCGVKIHRYDDNYEDIEYVKTTRGDNYFIHSGCLKWGW